MGAHMNPAEAARLAGIPYQTMVSRFKRYGMKPTDEQLKEIIRPSKCYHYHAEVIRAYIGSHRNLSVTARALNCKISTVITHIKRAGLPV
jgi:hypothetical protein